MKRQIIYPGAIPLETDLLNTNKNTMVALGKLVAATFGTGTFASGLGCNPNSPAALNVVINPGEIYSLQNLDGTAYSSLAADATHQIMKQGISLDAVTLACAAPGTAGQSINYLIQAAFSEIDSTPVVLPYYNASNPSQAYSGPANAGTTNNTARDGQVVLSAKAGVAATTGSQITPAADSGYVGLWVVTVSNGQTTIVAGNIVQAVSAPFFGSAALLNVLNAFTVSPTAPTPAQFDSSTKLATTAFVKSVGLQAGTLRIVGSSVSLTAADAGNTIFAQSGGAITLTLPAASSLPVGARIEFCSGSLFAVTLARASTDTIILNNSGGITSLAFGNGDTVTLECISASQWLAVSGSAQLGYSAAFASSTTTSGYQKLPTGLILQWGTLANSATTGTATAVTFPIAFPSLLMQIFISNANGYSTGVVSSNSGSLSGFNSFSSVSSSVSSWWAIGK